MAECGIVLDLMCRGWPHIFVRRIDLLSVCALGIHGEPWLLPRIFPRHSLNWAQFDGRNLTLPFFIIPGFVIGQRLHIQLISVKKVDIGVGHKLDPVRIHLFFIGSSLLKTKILVPEHFFVQHVPHLEGRVLHLVLPQLFLNNVQFFSIRRLLGDIRRRLINNRHLFLSHWAPSRIRNHNWRINRLSCSWTIWALGRREFNLCFPFCIERRWDFQFKILVDFLDFRESVEKPVALRLVYQGTGVLKRLSNPALNEMVRLKSVTLPHSWGGALTFLDWLALVCNWFTPCIA